MLLVREEEIDLNAYVSDPKSFCSGVREFSKFRKELQ